MLYRVLMTPDSFPLHCAAFKLLQLLCSTTIPWIIALCDVLQCQAMSAQTLTLYGIVQHRLASCNRSIMYYNEVGQTTCTVYKVLLLQWTTLCYTIRILHQSHRPYPMPYRLGEETSPKAAASWESEKKGRTAPSCNFRAVLGRVGL